MIDNFRVITPAEGMRILAHIRKCQSSEWVTMSNGDIACPGCGHILWVAGEGLTDKVR